MPKPNLYATLQKPRAARVMIAPPGRKGAARSAPELDPTDWLELMRFPFATQIRLIRADARRMELAAAPSISFVVLALAFFGAAYLCTGWALLHGALSVRAVDAFLLAVLVIVLLHVAVRYLVAPLGHDQRFEFDKGSGLLTVTTQGALGSKVERYRLRDVVKLHFNRIDDGIYDPGTMLVIFKGGGTLQFPAGPGVPRRVEAAVDALAAFLEVPRSDREAEAPPPRAKRRAAATLSQDDLGLEAWLAQFGPSSLSR